MDLLTKSGEPQIIDSLKTVQGQSSLASDIIKQKWLKAISIESHVSNFLERACMQ